MITKKQKIMISSLVLLIFILMYSSATQPEPHHFVFVHGAWHGAWAWSRLVQTFSKNDQVNHTLHNIELPGHGIDQTTPGLVTLQNYTDRVVALLDMLPEPAILVGHSMGGIVISSAAEARPAKIAALVYVAAFLVEDGKTMLDYAELDSDSLVGQNLIPNMTDYTIDINRTLIHEMFYAESRPFYTKLAETLIRPNPLIPFVTPLQLTSGNYGSVPKVYIKTLNDRAITPWLQDLMLTNNPVDAVYSMNTDHSPFFSKPKALFTILEDIASVY